MRVLLPLERTGEAVEPDPDEAVLRALYPYPDDVTWVRANMVWSVDGAAAGADGRSGSLSSGADKRVFAVLRTLADVVLVGAGTARSEGYGPEAPSPQFAARRRAEGRPPAAPFALVTRSGNVPTGTGLFGGDVATLVVTCEAAGPDALSRLRDLAGTDRVVVAGADDVDVPAALVALADLGLGRVLCEGGPTLLAAVTAGGALDELCLTWAPLLAGGDARRVLSGSAPGGSGVPLRAGHLLHADDDTLVGRWLTPR